jgi:Domain of unknown function (DUF4328)
VVVLLSAQVVLLGLRVLTLLNRIRVAGRITRHEWVSQASANAADAWVRGAVALWLLVFAATVIVWCVWQHRSQQAARDLVAGMETSPAWAVGCWFVPFVNYVKPFQAMRELWLASEGTATWQRQPTWPALGWWWATWLGYNVLGWLQTTTSGADLDAILRSDAIGLASVTLGVIAAILAIQIVRQVATRLEAAAVIASVLPGTAPPFQGAASGLPRPPGPPLPPPPGP